MSKCLLRRHLKPLTGLARSLPFRPPENHVRESPMLYTMLAVAMLGAAPSLGATGPGVMPPHAARITALALRHTDRPGIRVWSTHDEVYRRGERARIYFRTERDAFVTIFRIDTDGR